jgi:hypothetical protein
LTTLEHLQELSNKTTITVVSGGGSFIGFLIEKAIDLQPLVSFCVSVVGVLSGLIALIVGCLTVAEKIQSKRHARELHKLLMQEKSLEILNLKREYHENKKD